MSFHLLGAIADSSARNINSVASRLSVPQGKTQLPTRRSPKKLGHRAGCSSHSNHHIHDQSFPRDKKVFQDKLHATTESMLKSFLHSEEKAAWLESLARELRIKIITVPGSAALTRPIYNEPHWPSAGLFIVPYKINTNQGPWSVIKFLLASFDHHLRTWPRERDGIKHLCGCKLTIYAIRSWATSTAFKLYVQCMFCHMTSCFHTFECSPMETLTESSLMRHYYP